MFIRIRHWKMLYIYGDLQCSYSSWKIYIWRPSMFVHIHQERCYMYMETFNVHTYSSLKDVIHIWRSSMSIHIHHWKMLYLYGDLQCPYVFITKDVIHIWRPSMSIHIHHWKMLYIFIIERCYTYMETSNVRTYSSLKDVIYIYMKTFNVRTYSSWKMLYIYGDLQCPYIFIIERCYTYMETSNVRTYSSWKMLCTWRSSMSVRIHHGRCYTYMETFNVHTYSALKDVIYIWRPSMFVFIMKDIYM